VKVGKRGKRPTLAELRKQFGAQSDKPSAGRAQFGADAKADKTLRSGASCLNIIEKNGVLVAVRARPLNSREREARSPECIDFPSVTGVTVRGTGKSFAFDCVFQPQAAQRDVFDRTARPLLHRVLEGYNGCLFAYGQTGSGKTFTMQGEGSGANAGVIPLLCTVLFEQINERKASKAFVVKCSLLEIYNETLNDLLVKSGDARDLQIRDDMLVGGRGLFVDGLSEFQVESDAAVLNLVSDGQKPRAVGKTNMNEHSSRSHMILTMKVTICDVGDEAGVAQTVSKLHLIDLAGSERQKATGASGAALKEGAQINLSLSALGNVINALTEPKASGAKGRHVPYRDSKLTRLLQDSLGGNSHTVMICNVSPAEVNAEETTSCLRFAERAKRIENKASINIDPKAAKLAELMEENKALRAKVDCLETHISQLEEHYE
jgi:kinesin family protein 3/17